MKRLLSAGFAAATLASAAWAFAAQSRDSQTPRETTGAQTRSLRQEMARDLFDITPEQEKRLQELRQARRKDRQAFRDEMVKMRAEMRELMKDPQANAAKIDKLIDGRSRLRAEREKQALRDRREREEIFTPEQLDKMRKYRGLLRERFGAGAGWRTGAGHPGLAWSRGAWGWRMRPDAWGLRHRYSPLIW